MDDFVSVHQVTSKNELSHYYPNLSLSKLLWALYILLNRTMLGKFHNKADSHLTTFKVATWVDLFYLNYVFATLELSQELNFLKDSLQLRLIIWVRILRVDLIFFYSEIILILRVFFLMYVLISFHCSWLLFYIVFCILGHVVETLIINNGCGIFLFLRFS